MAPVKAPFSWPNSSDSSRFSGIAAQLTLMNGLSARRDFWCMYRAITSLPTPLSPVIRIEASDRATWSARVSTVCMAGSEVTSGRSSSDTAARTAAMRSASGGRGMNSLAPARIARAASSGSEPTPQATTGTRILSASLAAIRPAMSSS